jgi:hypothetical protein
LNIFEQENVLRQHIIEYFESEDIIQFSWKPNEAL